MVPSRGGHLREVKKTKSGERALRAGPQSVVPEYPGSSMICEDQVTGKGVLGEVNSDPRAPKSLDDQENRVPGGVCKSSVST